MPPSFAAGAIHTTAMYAVTNQYRKKCFGDTRPRSANAYIYIPRGCMYVVAQDVEFVNMRINAGRSNDLTQFW